MDRTRTQYLNTKQVAQVLGIPKRTLTWRLKHGKMPPPRQDERGNYLWTINDIELARAYRSESSID